MHTNREKAALLSQSILRVKDIRILMDCGGNKATEVAKEFRKWQKEKTGYAIEDIPTELFVECFNINEKRILHYAEKGY